VQHKIDLNEDDIAQVSKELKLMALELNVPVILLAELCFDLIRKDQELCGPRIADLGKAVSVERYADVLMLINRESYYCFHEAYCREAKVIITKNANGSIGIVFLKFWYEFAQFTEPTQELIGQT
jgi:replicative DNA helicase